MAFFTYLLRCADGHYYVGHTDNLEFRIAQHQSGELKGYTYDRRPVELVWNESFADRDQAFAAERRIKGWSRAKKEALIQGNWDAVRLLSRKLFLRDKASTMTKTDHPPDGPGFSSSAFPQDERFPTNSTHPEEGLSSAAASASKARLEGRQGPIIVLVRPTGQNIGKAARAMLNFGLTSAPGEPARRWPNPMRGGSKRSGCRARASTSVRQRAGGCRLLHGLRLDRPPPRPVMPVAIPKPWPLRSLPHPLVRRSCSDRRSAWQPRTSRSPVHRYRSDQPQIRIPEPRPGVIFSLRMVEAAASFPPPAKEGEPPAPHADLEGLIEQPMPSSPRQVISTRPSGCG